MGFFSRLRQRGKELEHRLEDEAEEAIATIETMLEPHVYRPGPKFKQVAGQGYFPCSVCGLHPRQRNVHPYEFDVPF